MVVGLFVICNLLFPNTTFNTQFCQAPIQPFTTEKPEGYKQYSSNILLGNANKQTKSNIYYNKH